MLELVLASTNTGKIAEIKDLLSGLSIKLIPQSEFDIPDIEETGLTFVENSILKARHASHHAGLPALADDSGLVIDALNGAPGVFSSRYAGPNASDLDRINKVLKALGDTDGADRLASFHCVATLIASETDPAPLICHGVWEGEILHEPRGDKGFGYDPIFNVAKYDCSAAEMEPSLKNSISHRAQAFQHLVSVLGEVLTSQEENS